MSESDSTAGPSEYPSLSTRDSNQTGTVTESKTENIPDHVQHLAYLLDDSIPIPGTSRRIGFDPIVSLLPVSGDILSALVSLYIIVKGFNGGVTRGAVLQMLFNIGIDIVIGATPILGDLFDASWKANARNIELLKTSNPAPGREASWGFLVVILVGFIFTVLVAMALVVFAVFSLITSF